MPVAHDQCIDIRSVLNRLVPRRRLQDLAEETGAVVRRRKVGIVELFWTLVLGFAVGNERTIAGLRRAFQKATGTTLVPSAFYDRFTVGLVRLLKAVLGEVVTKTAGPSRAMQGALAAFRDVLLTDSTVIRLHDLLAGAFPACRTNHTLAALKAHVILSVTGAGPSSVKVTSERVHDGPVLRAGKWVRDRLLIFDLGYYRFQLFACIEREHGYFLTRLKDKSNPLITAVHRGWRGRAMDLVGQRLQDVLGRMRREAIDLEVELSFRRRTYGGRRRGATLRCRLVGVRDVQSGRYHLYLTNIPVETLTAQDVARTYSARWLIELAFRELKQGYRIDEMPSSKRRIVEALLYAALVTMCVSRVLLVHLRRRLHQVADRLPDERWAALFNATAVEMLALMVRRRSDAESLATFLEPMLLKEAVDPNAARVRLLARVEQRRDRVLPAAA
jgi:IS4 transposase